MRTACKIQYATDRGGRFLVDYAGNNSFDHRNLNFTFATKHVVADVGHRWPRSPEDEDLGAIVLPVEAVVRRLCPTRDRLTGDCSLFGPRTSSRHMKVLTACSTVLASSSAASSTPIVPIVEAALFETAGGEHGPIPV